MREQFANAASVVLAANTTSGATSLSVSDASKFPTSGQFRILIDSEYLLVTAVSGTTFTVTRGAEGTTAASHVAPAAVTQILTLGGLTQWARDSVPLFNGSRPPYRLLDSSGIVLTSSDFTQLNAATLTTITDHSDGSLTLLTQPSGTSGLYFIGLARPLPATKQLIAALRPILQMGASAAWTACGVGWYDSISGKTKLMAAQNYNGGFHLTIRQFDTFTTGGTASFDEPLWMPGADSVFLKLYSDGTTLFYYVGDGDNWVQVYSEAVGVYLTPDHFVLGTNSKSSLNIVNRLVAWQEG